MKKAKKSFSVRKKIITFFILLAPVIITQTACCWWFGEPEYPKCMQKSDK